MRRATLEGDNLGMSNSRLPVIFLGHGSPMNALADNEYTRALSALAVTLPQPKAILMISAHWMTENTSVTHMESPKTIHDFYGFPKELFAVQYPAPGSPALAREVQQTVNDPKIVLDDSAWGLDHGTWAVLKYVFPKADIPVVQLSMDMTRDADFHFNLGKKLRPLREKGILIMGSGNIVHSLRHIDWNENAPPLPWVSEFDSWVKGKVDARNFEDLVQFPLPTEAGKLSVPTSDHYFPFLYILGAAQKEDNIEYIFEGFQNASMSMRCVKFG